jgi:hypothetical protein
MTRFKTHKLRLRILAWVLRWRTNQPQYDTHAWEKKR